MCDGKIEKGTASAVTAITCGCDCDDRDGKMERGEGHSERGGCDCGCDRNGKWKGAQRGTGDQN